MACGTPVVACDAGALPEVMRVGGGGLLVPPDDPEAMARGIRGLLDRPLDRETLGSRGRIGVDTVFAWRRVAEATTRVYTEVLEERFGRPTSTITSASRGANRPSASSA